MTKWITDHPIVVCSAARASALLMSTSTRGDVIACISIADPYAGKRPPKEGFYRVPHRLSMTFDDALDDGVGVIAPTRMDVEEMILFARTLPPLSASRRLVIHCHAGISRSTATALAILADRMGDEVAAAKHLVECCEDKEPFPNATIVSHADDFLARGGRLREAAGDLYRLGGMLVAPDGGR